MARPVDEGKRRELALAAVDVLRTHGLHISTSALAKHLGIKRPTLLYYFPERADLVEQALQDMLLEQAKFVLPHVAQFAHPIDAMFAQIQAVQAFYKGRAAHLAFLLQAVALADAERVRSFMSKAENLQAAFRETMIARLNQAMRDGQMAECDPKNLQRICRCCADGLVLQRVNQEFDVGPTLETLWELVLAPLKPEDQRVMPVAPKPPDAADR